MSTQDFKGFIRVGDSNPVLSGLMADNMARDLANRMSPGQALDAGKYLSESHLWTNGFMVFKPYKSQEDGVYGLDMIAGTLPHECKDPIRALKVRPDGTVTHEEESHIRYTVERLGHYVMLIGHDRKGTPVSAYYMIAEEDVDNNAWTFVAQYPLAGCYAVDGDTASLAVFGPRLPHYGGKVGDSDPGVFEGYRLNHDRQSLSILYGNRRVSHGDPSSPKYGEMRGGGGAGAVMGPMQWDVRATIDGLRVTVVHDEPFVSHSPRVKDGALLTPVASPYQGLEGHWAFASVLPLSHSVLRLFPKEVLKLMRAEIYARHGDTFKDPATQRYFDSQPWYKKSSAPIRLTDIELHNYRLIKYIEQSAQ